MNHNRNHRHSSDRARLAQIAHQAMIDRDLLPEFSRQVQREVGRIEPVDLAGAGNRRDCRQLLWSSIDNDDSLDLDQLTAAEVLDDGRTRILVAVADVDVLVTQGGAIDEQAGSNTTSVYTGVRTFPMLPERLSHDLTSLNPDVDRAAIVVEMEVGEAGTIVDSAIYAAVVRNHAKLAYDAVAAWLDGDAPAPAALERVPGLADNLRLQHRVAQGLRAVRYERGALDLQTIQTRAEFDGDRLVELAVDRGNCAKELIEDFMIAANGVTAEFLRRKEWPSLRRVVRSPTRWDRIVDLAAELDHHLPREPSSQALSAFLEAQRDGDPLRFPDLSLSVIKLIGAGEYVLEFPGEAPTGHFGLAVKNYTHSTAPNRRYPDLITQRLVKAALAGEEPPYESRRLADLARHCTDKEDDSDKVERRVRKSAGALLLESRIGERFPAIVTGASSKGTWVRIVDPHVEGMLVDGADSVDVGDYLWVELVEADVEAGYIDFKKLHEPRPTDLGQR
jgi:exoribonuclease-2